MQNQTVILLATVHSAEVTGEDRLIGGIKIPLRASGAKEGLFNLSHAEGEQGGSLELKITYVSHVAHKYVAPDEPHREVDVVEPVDAMRQGPCPLQGQDDPARPQLTACPDLPTLQTYDNEPVPEGMRSPDY